MARAMQLLIAPGKANAVIKRLAYDAVQVASLHHNDWVCVCQGLQHDLSTDETLEVQIRVLELITMLPELHVELLLSNTDMEQKLLQYVREVLSTSCATPTLPTSCATHISRYDMPLPSLWHMSSFVCGWLLVYAVRRACASCRDTPWPSVALTSCVWLHPYPYV